MRALLLLCTLSGCVDPNLVSCEDGRLCPHGTACDDAHHSCVSPDQLSACAGAPQLSACATSAISMGYCFDGVCEAAGCGNGFVEPGELCDDGNTVSGDGCSADCLSREICGDGFVDRARGEECDDGNRRGHDGCTAQCTDEEQVWRSHGEVPAPRQLAAGVYDAARHETVLFGGTSTVLYADTWTWAQGMWQAEPALGPAARIVPAIAYDPVRHQTLMFGGLGLSSLLNDTWLWNGATWVRAHPTAPPGVRYGAAAAWDGHRVILFGGSQLGVLLGDTWAWDGANWTQLAITTAPSARANVAMVYDEAHARIVLFGGKDSSGTPFSNDTWVFDGSSWAQLTTMGQPPLLTWAALAYDAARQCVVLEGLTSTGTLVTWELTGSTWVDRAPTMPSGSAFAPLVYDCDRQRVIQLTGQTSNTTQTNAVAEWDGTNWTAAPLRQLPDPRSACGIGSDPLRGRVVMFGGQGPSAQPPGPALDDLWEWDGQAWTHMTPAMPPPARFGHAISYDPNSHELLMFGGQSLTTPFADTWTWNGTRWLDRSHAIAPGARTLHAIATDLGRNRIVLFGGTNGSTLFTDTWEWDGTEWHDIPTGQSPPGRIGATMTYDIERGRIVMFGGVDTLAQHPSSDHTLADTWEWDGATWINRTGTSVLARSLHSLVYDRGRARALMFGGANGSLEPTEWDGHAWTDISTIGAPALIANNCATYDDARQEAVAFGGSLIDTSTQANSQITFTISYLGAAEEVCGSGEDVDGDGATGCADEDCLAVCEPLCWTTNVCTATPGCGDGVCGPVENHALCPSDCP